MSSSLSEQNQAGRAWIQAFYDKMGSDTFDIESWYNEFFQVDATLTHNSAPAIKGLKDICAHIVGNRARQSVKYVVKHVDVVPNRIYTEIDALITLKNDPQKMKIILSGLAVFHKKTDESKLSALRTYVDSTPLMERIRAIS
ncbi:unnamed protein product [Adineta ricciae]|uniref:SnoaL-like domain-containing protein n=1 Tax=Adineta ricciae TaxID=249248 RepID=A0A814SCJ2_ADIRI|nr:unnamed protein product [Adineta ricciae]CAF1302478.1 unnamed protein product [Adineta ricciae]